MTRRNGNLLGFAACAALLGYAYYAPAAMTDRTWYLYWIAVKKDKQARGAGGKLLRHVEEDARQRQGRVLFIETSGLPHYDLTRKFYLKHHYEVTGVLKEEVDQTVRVSLRSLGEVDVRHIAEQHHGGGHRFAAGFTSTDDIATIVRSIRAAL